MLTRRTFLVSSALLALMPTRRVLAHASPSTHFHLSYAELREALQHAKALLELVRVGTNTIGGRHAVLAVWVPARGAESIRLVSVRDGASTTPGYAVKVVPWNGLTGPGIDPYNGVNTRYAVTAPADAYVLAIKTNTGSKAGAIYAPYNPVYQTPEIVQAGRHYLEEVIRTAERRIAQNDVRSRVDPSKLVTEIVDGDGVSGPSLDADARVLLALMMDEHIDKDEYRLRGAGWTTDKVFVTLALNREDTYRYAISSILRTKKDGTTERREGARGIAQFIRGTYDNVRELYPNAGLPESFEDAMRDHEHSVVAQFCLIDRMLKALVDAKMTIPRDKTLLGQYLTVSYNGGEHRGIPWLREHQRMCVSKNRRCKFRHGMPDETSTYIKKYALVQEHLYGPSGKSGRTAKAKAKG